MERKTRVGRRIADSARMAIWLRNIRRNRHRRFRPTRSESLPYDQYILLNAETECKAWAESMKCLKVLESALGSKCDEKCRRDIEDVKSGYKYWRSYYKCAAYSY